MTPFEEFGDLMDKGAREANALTDETATRTQIAKLRARNAKLEKEVERLRAQVALLVRAGNALNSATTSLVVRFQAKSWQWALDAWQAAVRGE